MLQEHRAILEGDAVPVPKNTEHAKALASIGLAWLATKAPHELKAPPPDAAIAVLYNDFLRSHHLVEGDNELNPKRVEAFKQAIYGLFASQRGHPKIDFERTGNMNVPTMAEKAVQQDQSLGSAQGN